MWPSRGSQPTLQFQDLWPQCLTRASPTYKKFYHPLTTYPWASLAFFTVRCVFLNVHPQSAVLQLKVTIVCLSPMAMVTTLITVEVKLSSAVASTGSSADGPAWQSLRSSGRKWGGEIHEVCGGGSTKHMIIYFDWLETTRERSDPLNHPG